MQWLRLCAKGPVLPAGYFIRLAEQAAETLITQGRQQGFARGQLEQGTQAQSVRDGGGRQDRTPVMPAGQSESIQCIQPHLGGTQLAQGFEGNPQA